MFTLFQINVLTANFGKLQYVKLRGKVNNTMFLDKNDTKIKKYSGVILL